MLRELKIDVDMNDHAAPKVVFLRGDNYPEKWKKNAVCLEVWIGRYYGWLLISELSEPAVRDFLVELNQFLGKVKTNPIEGMHMRSMPRDGIVQLGVLGIPKEE